MRLSGLLGRRFQRWFRLPGRSAVDMTASLVSSSSVGLLVTIGQFERGYYTAREASLIACSFSIVSVPFCVLIAGIAGIDAVFFGWYLTVIASCLVAAVVLSCAEVVPAVVAPAMGMATLAAILVFYTPVFSWLALPTGGYSTGVLIGVRPAGAEIQPASGTEGSDPGFSATYGNYRAIALSGHRDGHKQLNMAI